MVESSIWSVTLLEVSFFCVCPYQRCLSLLEMQYPPFKRVHQMPFVTGKRNLGKRESCVLMIVET